MNSPTPDSTIAETNDVKAYTFCDSECAAGSHTSCGPCARQHRWRAQLEAALALFDDYEELIDYAGRWLHDSQQWEGDEHLAPKFAELRERAAKLRGTLP